MVSLRASFALVFAALTLSAAEPPARPEGLFADFVTPRGTVTVELYYRQTPLTVASFVGLAEGTLGPKPGAPFFRGLKFHRVVPRFVVQGGDPLGTGEGGPGYSFPDEFVVGLRHDEAGVLSMANDGPDTNGSQFFLTLRDVNRLNYLHSVFGRVVRGREVLPLIQQDDPMTEVQIVRIGAAALAFRADQAAFDALVGRTKKFTGPAEPGPAAHFHDPDHLLPAEPPRALAFQRKLANFERATGQKIYVRLLAKFAPEKPQQSPGRLAGSMAKQLGLPAPSALAVYFADQDQWGLWLGEAYLPAFTGKAGAELQAMLHDGSLHRAKESFFTAARQAAAVATVDYATSLPAGQDVPPAQKLKLQVDAVIDALIFKFEFLPSP